MNFRQIVRLLGNILFIEALFLLPPVFLALYDGEMHVFWALMATIGALTVVFLITKLLIKPKSATLYARDGFVLVALAWVSISAFGCLPFLLSGEIPNIIDALFESVAGFTTTGSTILTDISALSRSLVLWCSFTNWMGGMGILVFMLAILPAAKGSGDSLLVIRAESTGPSVEKIVPKTRQHAAILYLMYLGMSALCLIALLIAGLPAFDSFCVTFGTAGTGGFAIRPDSVASYSPAVQIIITIFMALFGINYNLYFLLLAKRVKTFFRDEELRFYLLIMLSAIVIVTLNIMSLFQNIGDALRESSLTVSSILTTTGYSSANFDAWPQLSRIILLLLMCFGGCAGSTAGGIKIARLIMLVKIGYRGISKLLHPRSVMLVKMNKRAVPENVLYGTTVYMIFYFGIMFLSLLLISLNNLSLDTTLSSVIACLNNIGPGLGDIGPTGSYAVFSPFSKIVLTFDMLFGRLEIFPLLLLFHHRSWNHAA